jgi:hypothetical protein
MMLIVKKNFDLGRNHLWHSHSQGFNLMECKYESCTCPHKKIYYAMIQIFATIGVNLEAVCRLASRSPV